MQDHELKQIHLKMVKKRNCEKTKVRTFYIGCKTNVYSAGDISIY